MVGDILGKSWGSTPAPPSSKTHVGIPDSNPNLFGDLVGAALGQGKNSNSNVPLKSAPPSAPQRNSNSFSMGNMANSLPRSGPSINSNSGNSNFGIFSTAGSSASNSDGGRTSRGLSGMKSGPSTNSNKDPFGSLVDFGTKQSPIGNSSSNKNSTSSDYSFGEFQNAPKAPNSSSFTKMDDFGIPPPPQDFTSQMPPPPAPAPVPQSKGVDVDPLDMLFSSSSSTAASGSTAAAASNGSGNQPFSEIDDWGLDSEFGGSGNDIGGDTTELEGLPPPPAGVTATMAKGKGFDNHKQGQHADAIKWLSWAVVLLEKAADDVATVEVLSCRASCYKEVGEYKKAIADCSKILEQDSTNVSVLLQRALLYESSEKYKLGAEDLRAVLKIDPGNRLAKSTIHRLIKMAD